MASKEAARKDGIDFVVIVTPNSQHYAAAKSFLSHSGISVVCDKPLTFETAEAEELSMLAKKKDLLFSASPTPTRVIRRSSMRGRLIRKGEIGDIRYVNAEYPQEWLATPAEEGGGNKQASWRTDPKQSGKSCCTGDIGSHVENHRFLPVTGLEIELALREAGQLSWRGGASTTNATIMVNYKGGAKGLYWASQIAVG